MLRTRVTSKIQRGQIDDGEDWTRPPSFVFVDADNRIAGTGHDPVGPLPGWLSGDKVHDHGPHAGSYDDNLTLAW